METAPIPPTSANTFKLWKWEIFSCALAIGTLGSMYGILFCYDDQRIPDWGTAINLSTLIALLATLLRAMLSFVVAEIIGQAKWKYFAGGGRPDEDVPMRRLIETSRFNDACQGSLGAIKLLPTIFRDPATLLSVMVMIISLGTGSFVQQAIQTRSCQFPMDSAHASLPISRNINFLNTGEDILTDIFNSSKLAAALSSALAPDSEELGSPISVGCPTGDCTFQNPIGGVYSTFGVCDLCSDTSSLIISSDWTLDRFICEDVIANYTLPSGLTAQVLRDTTCDSQVISPFAELVVISEEGLDWAGDLVSPEMKALSQWAFTNVTILAPNWLPTSPKLTKYVAATCTLYPCLRSYNGSVTSGQLDEVLVNTVPAVPDVAALFEPDITTEAVQEALPLSLSKLDISMYSADVRFQAVQSPCVVNDTVWTKENKSSTLDLQRVLLLHADPDLSGARRFRIENTTAPAECIYGMQAMAVERFLMADYLFNGSCVIGEFNGGTENASMIYYCGETYGETYWLESFFDDNGTTAASIIERVKTFTDRISNKLRMGLLNNPEVVSGQVLQASVCSRIYYSWLTFPAVLVAVTSGLLAWTMFQSSRHPGREMVWKTSILPFLFYGERFVVQNGEDVSGHSTGSSRRDEAKESLLSLDQMEEEARQRKVRFDVS